MDLSEEGRKSWRKITVAGVKIVADCLGRITDLSEEGRKSWWSITVAGVKTAAAC